MPSAVYSAKGVGVGAAVPASSAPPLVNNLGVGDKAKPYELNDITSLAVYASDAQAIRNNFFWMAKRIEVLEAALKAAGIPV